jgi:NADPH-dependent 2,4-dienoyl-CoA reductase/sulfur reductase-like enzyme/bacterioferritin-associated ferredoxin
VRHVDLTIVGAGPAGIAAAGTAASRGLQVVLLDERSHPGGQVLVGAEKNPQHDTDGRAVQRGRALLAKLQHLQVEIQSQTIVWGIDGCRIASACPEGTQEIEASAVIIATGAREFVPAFPGWTLPGVMTLGGAQNLIKRHAVLPGRSMLIAGTGPLMWALAANALEQGGNVRAIFDASQLLKWAGTLAQINALRDRVGLALHYWKTIVSHQVPYRWLRDHLQAHGVDELESVSIGSRSFDVDTLCVGFGFRPNIELLQLAGSSLKFDSLLGGWIPVLDGLQQTDRPGVYAAGECAGVGGAEKALVEGELAALSVLSLLGQTLTAEDQKRMRWLHRRRRNEIRFAKILNKASKTPEIYRRELEDDTLLCRCESVRVGQVRHAFQQQATSLDELKNELRVGQGMCQGRTCGPLLQWLLCDDRTESRHPLSPFHVRPPIKPIALDKMEKQV